LQRIMKLQMLSSLHPIDMRFSLVTGYY
jgi:hypothetical protein